MRRWRRTKGWLVVTIDRELLRRVDASVKADLAAEDIARMDEGLHFITATETG